MGIEKIKCCFSKNLYLFKSHKLFSIGLVITVFTSYLLTSTRYIDISIWVQANINLLIIGIFIALLLLLLRKIFTKEFTTRFGRIIDSLSTKYNIIYLIKKHIWVTTITMFTLSIFIALVEYLKYIETKGSGYHFVLFIAHKFVSVIEGAIIVTIITMIIISIRAFYNDENVRINEDENFKVKKKILFNLDIDNVNIELDKTTYYKSPEVIENLLKWVDFNKEAYFRIHYGSLDISKLTLNKFIYKEKGNDISLNLSCSLTSFYNIIYTHYFPDYILSSSSSTDLKNKSTLRYYLHETLERLYSKEVLRSKKFELTELLPNPIGITGIISLQFSNVTYYLLQVRHGTDAAAKDKVQWSFAGTIDFVPKFYKNESDIKFKDLVIDELEDEIIHKHDIFTNLGKMNPSYKLIGFVLNTLYLYQPEFFVHISYRYKNMQEVYEPKELKEFENKIKELAKNFQISLNCQKSIQGKIIAVDSLEVLQGVINKEYANVKVRNLFAAGYEFLEKSL